MTMSPASIADNIGIDEAKLSQNLLDRLKNIYPDHFQYAHQRLLGVLRRYYPKHITDTPQHWSEQDVLLISYGDSILEPDTLPLQSLHRFLNQYLKNIINSVHILPFFPYSSDDGFSVIDYRKVNPELGDWSDINSIARDYKLMADLVINHVSRESLWFYDFVGNNKPACDYFIEQDPETDLSMVTRPRNTPLLVPVNTHRGTRYLWATFSEDQIDLNFANPDVLCELVDIFLSYIHHGTKLIRLDAIAFLWKQLGTNCIHLEQTHEVVKLLRTIINHLYPECILLTETNVPHTENMSYFGQGDEAHMIYQFPLPPLVLHALNRGSATHLYNWASQLPPLPENCTYLNFTASHDGIGLRALEGILSQREIDDLLDSMHRFGGFVSMKANQNGDDSPYEINISLFDAMQGTRRGPDQWQVQRFLCSQAIMLSLQGIPALYIHSLTATPNDLHSVELTGRTRSINRKKWQFDELSALLQAEHTPNHEVFFALKQLLQIRRNEACFNPHSHQSIIDTGNSVFTLLRTEPVTGQRLLALHNVTASPQAITLTDQDDLLNKTGWHDLISDSKLTERLTATTLQPYQVMWLIEAESVLKEHANGRSRAS
ncbi:MAG: sugar phosphorylase [Gammaproteobacteria bacterium]